MNKAEEKRQKMAQRHPTVEFQVDGEMFRLVFERSEYRAYKYSRSFAKWCDMMLGGLDVNVLKQYIVKQQQQKGD